MTRHKCMSPTPPNKLRFANTHHPIRIVVHSKDATNPTPVTPSASSRSMIKSSSYLRPHPEFLRISTRLWLSFRNLFLNLSSLSCTSSPERMAHQSYSKFALGPAPQEKNLPFHKIRHMPFATPINTVFSTSSFTKPANLALETVSLPFLACSFLPFFLFTKNPQQSLVYSTIFEFLKWTQPQPKPTTTNLFAF